MNRRASSRSSMITKRFFGLINPPSERRTDYTYARTISYLPKDLASPTADKQKPNMKRYPIRRMSSNYSAATSTSHRNSQSCDDYDLRSQPTIPVATFYSNGNSIGPIDDCGRSGISGQVDIPPHPKVFTSKRSKSGSSITTTTSCGWFNFIIKRLLAVALIGLLLLGCFGAYLFWQDDMSKLGQAIIGKYRAKFPVLSDDVNAPSDSTSEVYDERIKNLRKDLIALSKYVHHMHTLILSQHQSEQANVGTSNIHRQTLNINRSIDTSDDCRLALNKFDNDKTGLLDFAHTAMGGQIYTTGCTQLYRLSPFSKSNKPDIVLSSSVMPGECWPFKGRNGSISIKIAQPIYPTAFSYEHINRKLSLFKDNAPFSFAIKSWNVVAGRTENKFNHGISFFRWNETKIQTFHFEFLAPSDYRADVFEFSILDNWGNNNYTCLYRIRIHGNP